MVSTLQLGEITVDVTLKDIKNVHLSVYPPTGSVRISAPLRMNLDTIRVFAISRLGWIRQQQKKINEQERETPRAYVERESHYVWGKRYLLHVVEADAAPSVQLQHGRIVFQVRPGTDAARRQEILDAWYRTTLRAAIPAIVAKWGPVMGVKADRFFVQRMKTKWGSCSPKTGSIRLNTDLAKKPRECFEYIVVHEMAHLIEPTHNSRFIEIMGRLMPGWRHYRQALNRLPLRHVNWDY
jgi:predicted metal-dependent hydrolase